jgi:hypothetical protein
LCVLQGGSTSGGRLSRGSDDGNRLSRGADKSHESGLDNNGRAGDDRLGRGDNRLSGSDNRLSGSDNRLSGSDSGLGGDGRSSRRHDRSSTTAGTVPHLGAWDGVAGESAIQVEQDAGVGGSVSTRDGNTSGESLSTGRCNLDLHALHVELSTAGAVALMKSNDLRTEKILAGSEVRDRDAVLALVGNQSVNRPLLSGGIISVLGELDPDVTSTVGLGGGDVGDDRTLVGLVKLLETNTKDGMIQHTGSMMSSEASRLLWCHSKVTLSPLLTEIVLAVAALFTLHVMDEEVTSLRGSLLGGERTYPAALLPRPWSTSLTKIA